MYFVVAAFIMDLQGPEEAFSTFQRKHPLQNFFTYRPFL
jgi:hypothetical protein